MQCGSRCERNWECLVRGGDCNGVGGSFWKVQVSVGVVGDRSPAARQRSDLTGPVKNEDGVQWAGPASHSQDTCNTMNGW